MLGRLKKTAVGLTRRLYPRLGLRESDVILASYPKSGNTWVRFIWANLVSLMDLNGEIVDFHTLNEAVGSEFDNHQFGRVEFDCLPRLVKTHQGYSDRAFGPNRSVYLCRHPGDVMVSYHRFLRARDHFSGVPEDLSTFLRSKDYGLPAWCKHVAEWWRHADSFVTYGDLQEDTVAAMSRILVDLDIGDVPQAILREAVERSRFDRLRALEESRGRPREPDFDDEYRFMRKGTRGEWKDLFGHRDRRYLYRSVENYELQDLWRETFTVDADN